jgi:hypothetical protein
MMKSNAQVKRIGSLFKLKAFKTANVFAHCIAWDEKMGYLMRISALEQRESSPTYEDLKRRALFPPVFVGLDAAVKAREWLLVSKMVIDHEAIPAFKATNQSPPDLEDASWYIRNSGKSKFVGRLSPEEKELETYQIWGYRILEERIRESMG